MAGLERKVKAMRRQTKQAEKRMLKAASRVVVLKGGRVVAAGPLTTGQQFQATVWAQGTGVTGTNTLAVSWFNSAGTYLGNSQSPPLPGGQSNWTVHATPGAFAKRASVVSNDVAAAISANAT